MGKSAFLEPMDETWNAFYRLRKPKYSYCSGWHDAPALDKRAEAAFRGRPVYQLLTVAKWVSTTLVIPTEKGVRHREYGSFPTQKLGSSYILSPCC